MRAGHQKCKETNTMATVTNSISQRKSGSECVPHVCLKVSGRIPLYWPKRYKLHDLDISGQQLNIMLQLILDHDSYI